MKKKDFFGGFFLGIIVGVTSFSALKYPGISQRTEADSVHAMQKTPNGKTINASSNTIKLSSENVRSHNLSQAEIKIMKVRNLYLKENSGDNWWYWVKDKIVFQLEPSDVTSEMKKTRLFFEYGVHGDQQLTIYLWEKDESHKIVLNTKNGERSVYDKVLDISPALLTQLTIATNGEAKPLSKSDSRRAAYTISNLKVTPV
ncbi:hypothetical protein [Legionella parisiensis]|uniref:Uncharacterized protein n=1 Tax=Legionella parisiensis TaxID=45071 RepID=A0A1E5JL40_9GAMM|nr:hypothetical protein [Legionella parisiensis]KTD43973.1 hypothetical protein Lpar_0519 [Legionella parisiensis]OEH45271.1 hypothetical protein lpari_03751 [Legionella parisiensis]STX76005.1 Uncharacterised protein [Legionella parisiensis]